MKRLSAAVLTFMVGLAVGPALIVPARSQSMFDERRSQFYFGDRRVPFWGGWGQPFSDQSAPTIRQHTPNRPADYSKAPAARKKTGTTRTVLVLGDSMADWLGYGLEEAFEETPEVGVVRKIRTVSGLIDSDSRGAAYDWPSAAREMTATEKPDVVVVMLGLSDRQAIRNQERSVRGSSDPKAVTDDENKDGQAKRRPPKVRQREATNFRPRNGKRPMGGASMRCSARPRAGGRPSFGLGCPP